MRNHLDPDGERMHTLTDADQARLWAIEALQRGRLDLGAALVRIALTATRVAAGIPQGAPKTGLAPQTPAEDPASCVACGSTDPAERRHAGGYLCDDPGRFHTSEPGAPVEWCHGCSMMIRWSAKNRQWGHINAGGSWVTSPLPAHDARPAPTGPDPADPAVRTDADDAEPERAPQHRTVPRDATHDLSPEAQATIAAQLDQKYAGRGPATAVIESARCLAGITGKSGGGPVGQQCWGVLYHEPVTEVWRHLLPEADADHTPEPYLPGDAVEQQP